MWIALSLGCASFLGFTAAALAAQAPAPQMSPPPAAASPLAPVRPAATISDDPDALDAQVLRVRRIFVDRLTGGETAAQMRDLVIASLHSARLFIAVKAQQHIRKSEDGAGRFAASSQYCFREGVIGAVRE